MCCLGGNLLTWANAESIMLHREDMLGIRRLPIATNWDAIMVELQNAHSAELDVPYSDDGAASEHALRD